MKMCIRDRILDEQQSKQFQELFQGFLYHPLETCVLELEKDCHVYLDHISRLKMCIRDRIETNGEQL